MAIPFTTDTVDLYSANNAQVSGANRYVVYADPVLLESGVKCQIQRGNRLAKDALFALGMDANLAAIVYFDYDSRTVDVLSKTRAIVDQLGVLWFVASEAEIRPDSESLSFVKMILQKSKTRLVGIPIYERTTLSSAGRCLCSDHGVFVDGVPQLSPRSGGRSSVADIYIHA